jgi:branched-chain amino acid transport system substrate-binding protein
VILLAWSCSLGVYDYGCDAPADCRDALGFGWTCGEAGLCEAVTPGVRCEDTFPDDLFQRPEDYRGARVIGTLFDHSTDIPETQSVRLAVKNANDYQGLDGRDFALVQCTYEENSELDGKTMEEATEDRAVWLSNELGAKAIVGPATSGMTEAAFEAAGDQYDTLFVSPSATSPALTNLDQTSFSEEKPGLIWRTAPPDSLQGAALADDVGEEVAGPVEVAVIYQEGPYGSGLADVFEEEFANENHTVSLHPFTNDSERDTAVNEVATAGVDAVLFISSEVSDDVAFINAAYAREEYADLPIWLADAARDQQLLDGTTDSLGLYDNIRGSAPAAPDNDVYTSFAASYRTEYGDEASESSYTAFAYDAAWLALYGAAWAHAQEPSETGTTMARGLRHITSGDPDPFEVKPLSWGEIKTAFEAGEDIDLAGASGDLDYDLVTGETSAPIDLWTVVYGCDDEGRNCAWTFETVDQWVP